MSVGAYNCRYNVPLENYSVSELKALNRNLGGQKLNKFCQYITGELELFVPYFRLFKVCLYSNLPVHRS